MSRTLAASADRSPLKGRHFASGAMTRGRREGRKVGRSKKTNEKRIQKLQISACRVMGSCATEYVSQTTTPKLIVTLPKRFVYDCLLISEKLDIFKYCAICGSH